MITYMDITFVSDKGKKIYRLHERIKEFRKIKELWKFYHFCPEIKVNGQLLELGTIKTTAFHNNNLIIQKGKFQLVEEPKLFYYFNLQVFAERDYIHLWRRFSQSLHIECYFCVRCIEEQKYVNTDFSHRFLNYRYHLYLADDCGYLTEGEHVLIDRSFPTKREMIAYINQKSSKHRFASIEQIKRAAKKLDDEQFYFEVIQFQPQ